MRNLFVPNICNLLQNRKQTNMQIIMLYFLSKLYFDFRISAILGDILPILRTDPHFYFITRAVFIASHPLWRIITGVLLTVA